MFLATLAVAATFNAVAWQPQLDETVAVGKPYTLAPCNSGSTVACAPPVLFFKPSKSTATVSNNGVLVPDVAGSYVITVGVANDASSAAAPTLVYLRAVDLQSWSRGSATIMSDTFGSSISSNASLASTDTAYNFWVITNTTAATATTTTACTLVESAEVGLEMTVSPSSLASMTTTTAACGLRTRPACPYGTAAQGCGYSSGPATVNPFAGKVMLSLLDVAADAPGASGSDSGVAGALWLTASATETSGTAGAIKMEYGGSSGSSGASSFVALGWVPTAASSWITIANVSLPPACVGLPRKGLRSTTAATAAHRLPQPTRDLLQIKNLSLTLAISTFSVAVQCDGGGNSSVVVASGAHNINWRTFAPSTAGELGVGIGVLRGTVRLKGFAAASLIGDGHMRALLAPVPNLSGGSASPYLGVSHPLNLTALGYLDPTKHPFNADPTGTADSTAALQAAVEYTRRNYLVLWLPPNSVFKVSNTIIAKETNRLDAVDGSNGYWQQGRYAPVRWVGSTKGAKGSAKPTLLLAPGTFTDPANPKPVVWYWYQSGNPKHDRAPYSVGTSQPNANCNQIFQGIDIKIGDGNPGAIGIRARGAQMMVVQDVAIYLNDGLVGLSGGAGSGGSHYGVTVVGGRYGADLTTAQPGPTLTGITLINQSCSALVYSGLQALTAVGIRIEAGVPLAQPAIITGCSSKNYGPPDWNGTFFVGRCTLPQFVAPEIVQPCIPSNSGSLTMVDSVVEFGSWAAALSLPPTARTPASSVGVAAAASLYLVNVHFSAHVATLVSFHGGETLLPPAATSNTVTSRTSTASAVDNSSTMLPSQWSFVQEYAHGVHQAAQGPDDSDTNAEDLPMQNQQHPHSHKTQASLPPPPSPPALYTSRVHMFNAASMRHLPPNTLNNVITTFKVGIVAQAAGPSAWLTAKHLYNGVDARGMPSYESPGAVFAVDYGASPFGVLDNTDALKAAFAAAVEQRGSKPSDIDGTDADGGAGGVVVLGRGVFRVKETVLVPPGVSLVGAGLHLTSVVPTSVGFKGGTPVLKTVGGATVLAALSVSTWAHYNNVTAVEWSAGVDSVWYQVHVNRMPECGISGGTPLLSAPQQPSTAAVAAAAAAAAAAATPLQSHSAASPGVTIPACRPASKLGLPLVLVSGSGSFYNFYNEDAMGNMVADDYQLPSYRHILVRDTADVRFYHFNPEHSVANANSEFRNSSNISVFGTKSEGHSATLWVRDCKDVFHTGHGGNAFPYSCSTDVCPTWSPSPCACNWTAGTPSLFRVDNCTGNCRFGNVWAQDRPRHLAPGADGPTYTAFYGVGGVGSSAGVTTGPMERPVVVGTSSTLSCAVDPDDAMSLLCLHAPPLVREH